MIRLCSSNILSQASNCSKLLRGRRTLDLIISRSFCARGKQSYAADSLSKELASLKLRQIQYFFWLIDNQKLQGKGREEWEHLIQCKEGTDHRNFFLQNREVHQQWEKGELSIQDMQLGVARKKNLVKKETKEQVKEKTHWELEIVSVNQNEKIKIIKSVREILGLGLKEAKEAIEKLPNIVKKEVPTEEANKLKKQLEEAGCKVQLK